MLPHLIASGEGDIVTLASEAGRRGLPGEAVYCASKFGQVGFTRALDHELREHGSAARTSARAASRRTSRSRTARPAAARCCAGMMRAEDVAEVVVFVLTRPRNHRILETALRPMTEASWG